MKDEKATKMCSISRFMSELSQIVSGYNLHQPTDIDKRLLYKTCTLYSAVQKPQTGRLQH